MDEKYIASWHRDSNIIEIVVIIKQFIVNLGSKKCVLIFFPIELLQTIFIVYCMGRSLGDFHVEILY